MIIQRIFICNDVIFKYITVDLTFYLNKKIKKVEVWYKSEKQKNWTLCKIPTFSDNDDHIKIDIAASRCEQIRISHEKNKSSSIKLQGKWIPLKLVHRKVKTDNPKSNLFPAIIKSKSPALTKQSPFHEVTQYLVEKYYLKPYPGDKSQRKIKRQLHGATHVSCATLTADNAEVIFGLKRHVEKNSYNGGLFIELLKSFLPNDFFHIIKKLNYGNDLTEEDFLLTKYALFCHDIANTSECFSDEKAHAAIFKKEMLELGFQEKIVEKFAFSMMTKDSKEKENIFQMIIHDGDCLEINRVLPSSDQFDIEELDIVKLLKKHSTTQMITNFLSHIYQLSRQYFNLLQYIYQDSNKHQECELSKNCYQTVTRTIQEFSLFSKLEGIYKYLGSLQLNPLEVYLPYVQNKTMIALNKRLALYDKESDKKMNADELYKQKGIFVRIIESVELELKTLNKNKEVLNEKGIKDSAQLKKYFCNSGKKGNNDLLPGFLYRPATFIKEGFKIDTYISSLGLMINPFASATWATHFYKRNIRSHAIASDFEFSRPIGGAKETGSLSKLIEKLTENEKRRRGEEWDNYNRCYAAPYLDHNEVLLSYLPESIIGVFFSDYHLYAKSAIKYKLELESILKRKMPVFFYEAKTAQLSDISNNEMAYLAGYQEEKNEFIIDSNRRFLNLILNEYKLIHSDRFPAYQKMNPADLEEIKCSLAQANPSPACPVKYSFVGLKTHNLKGEAYVENGLPVIEVNTMRYYDSNHLLFRIACEHQKRLVKLCNQLLNNKVIMDRLLVKYIQLELVHNPKTFLRLTYEPLKSFEPSYILNRIGYNLSKNWKWEQMSVLISSSIVLRLSIVQSLDAVYNTLQSYLSPHRSLAPVLA